MSRTLESETGWQAVGGADAPDLPPGASQPQGLLARAARVPLERWRLSLACLLVSVAVSLMVGLAFGRKSYRGEGILLYTPIALPEFLKNVYNPSRLESMIALVKEPGNLDTVLKEFDLPLTREALDRKVKVAQVPKTENVSVSLDWGDGETAAAIVNRLMELHVARLAEIRRAKADESIASLQAALQPCVERRDAAQRDYDRFRREKNILDVKTERERLGKEVTDIEAKLVEAQRDFGTAQARIKKMEQMIEELDARTRQEKPEALAAEVEAEKSYIERKKKLQESLRDEEGRLAETRQELRQATQKYQDDLRGVQGGYVKRVEAEESAAKVRLLEIRSATSKDKIDAMKEELRVLPVEYLRTKRAELVEKAAEQRDQVRVGDGFISQVRTSLTNKRREMQQLLVELGEAEEKEKRVKELEAERLQYENQLVALRQLRTSEVSEVKVLTPATPGADAVGSSFRKVAAAAFAVPLALLLGLLVAGELTARAGTQEGMAARLGLPVLARLGGDDSAARALALRLRQGVPGPGGVVLFSPLDEGGEAEELVGDVSRFLALQGEKVLLLDARIARPQGRPLLPWADPLADVGDGEAGQAGLAQYLVFEGQDVRDFVRPTRFASVEHLPSGGPCSTTDVLASQPMRGLLAGLRKSYSFLLVIGTPVFEGGIDTEVLAGYAGGMLLLVNGPVAGAAPALQGFVRSLKDANAPLLGCVLCEE